MRNPIPKTRSDSKLPKLNPEQRETLMEWLDEKKISYREAARRATKQWGSEYHHETIARYYRKIAAKRNLDELKTSVKHARAMVKAFGTNTDDVFQASVRLFAQASFDLVTKLKPGAKPDFGPIRAAISLLLLSRKDEREGKKLELERERWEFDAVRACFAHHQELQAIMADQSLDEDAQLEAIRLRVFGKATGEVKEIEN